MVKHNAHISLTYDFLLLINMEKVLGTSMEPYSFEPEYAHEQNMCLFVLVSE